MRGEYQHNIDAKGRMIFPVRLREELGEHAVIFRGLDHCLTVFPAEKWEKLQEKLDALPMSAGFIPPITRWSRTPRAASWCRPSCANMPTWKRKSPSSA